MARIRAVETLRLAELPNLAFVVLHADAGQVGLGETYYGAGAVEAVVHETLAPALLGRPVPTTPAEVRAAVDPRAFYVGTTGSGAEVRARSAVDIALWDLMARTHGVPLTRVLGERLRDALPIYNTCAGPRYMRDTTGQRLSNWGLPEGGAPAATDDLWAFMHHADRLAEDLLRQGVGAMKIWPFDPAAEATGGQSLPSAQLAAAVEPLRKIRAAVGDRMRIMIELHGLWEPGPAARILDALAPFDVAWAEDPLAPHRVEELARLRSGSPVRIAAGETAGAGAGAGELVRRGAVDVLIADLGWCGGITGALAQAQLAAAAGVEFALHDCGGPVVLAASVQLAAVLPHVTIQETTRSYYADWYPQVVTGLPRIGRGQVHVGDGPGHGLALAERLHTRPDVTRRVASGDGEEASRGEKALSTER
jgi:L-alanine-DL-glutamate epimerase-like enolase superfamily enzyme